MLDDPFKYGLLAALAIALVVALVGDLRRREIGNWLNAGIAVAAPLFWWASGLDLWPGIAWQLAVAAITFAFAAGLFALRAMGGGDVKLLTALALWIPPLLFLKLVVIMSVLGGVLALAVVIVRLARRQKVRGVYVPYGPSIAIAGLWVLGTSYFPLASAGGATG